MLRGRHGVALLAGALVLGLAGCATPAPSMSTSASSSARVSPTSPATVSNATMVASALSVFRRYVQASNAIVASSSASPDPLRQFLSAEQYASDSADLQALREGGKRISGPAKLKNYEVQSIDARAGTAALYICLDESKARVIDAVGRDVTPANRPAGVTLLAKFIDLRSHPEISRSDRWLGSSIC